VYDVFGYVHPNFGAPHDGMKFTTPDVDNDLSLNNCATWWGGGWWSIQCGIWNPNSNNPIWYSLGDDGWYLMERAHMMIKPQ